MGTQNTVLRITMFGSGIRPRALTPNPYYSESNWLFFVKEGALSYSDKSVKTTLLPNHVYILPAYKSFMLLDVEGEQFNHIYAEINCSQTIENIIDLNITENDFLKDFFILIMNHSKTIDSITLTMLINTVLHQVLPVENGENDIARQIKLFIDQKLPLFSVNDIIKNFHYSKRYLDKKFKAAYNTSIVKYGKNEQLFYAANALKDGASLSDICDKLNYSSPANLSRDFKKHYGESPLRFRKYFLGGEIRP